MKKFIFASITFLSVCAFTGCNKEENNELPDECKNIIMQGQVTFPTAFTPNGDGKNDLSRVRGQQQDQWTGFEFTIRRLNGDVVFQTNDVNAAWDGHINGSLSADRLYRVTIKFTLGAQNYDLCTYLYLLRDNGGCIDASDININEQLRFEDQYDPSSGIFVFVTAEEFC